MWSQIYNGNQIIGTNAISFLQVIQNDFARLESETREAESEVLCIFDEFIGKAVEGAWDSVDTDTTILIVVRTQPESSVNTLSVIQDIDPRICPTVVQAGAFVTLEDYEDTLHKCWEESTVICLYCERIRWKPLIGNLIRDSDSHSDTDIRRRRMIFRSCMTEFLTCTIFSDGTVPNKTEVCNSDTKWM